MAKRRLKSRKPFGDEAHTLLAYNTNAPTWIHETWKGNPSKNILRRHSSIPKVGSIPTGHELSGSRLAWVPLTRLCNGVGRFGFLMYKWGLITSEAGKCGAKQQTANNILYNCSIYSLPGAVVLSSLVQDDDNIKWLLEDCPDI